MGVCVYGCTCAWVYVCMGVCVHGCMCAWVYVCMGVCVHGCILLHTNIPPFNTLHPPPQTSTYPLPQTNVSCCPLPQTSTYLFVWLSSSCVEEVCPLVLSTRGRRSRRDWSTAPTQGLSSGSHRVQRSMRSASFWSTPPGGMGGLCFCMATAIITAMGIMSWNGILPTAISYRTIPKLYTSAGNWYRLLIMISGAVQCTVPTLPGAQTKTSSTKECFYTK